MSSILDFFQGIMPVVEIVITLLALFLLMFTILLFWRIWCVFGQISKFMDYLNFNQERFRETLYQIERFCRIYSSIDFGSDSYEDD